MAFLFLFADLWLGSGGRDGTSQNNEDKVGRYKDVVLEACFFVRQGSEMVCEKFKILCIDIQVLRRRKCTCGKRLDDRW